VKYLLYLFIGHPGVNPAIPDAAVASVMGSAVPATALLEEDGDPLLEEDGSYLLEEG
jgi:hypothetical protein